MTGRLRLHALPAFADNYVWALASHSCCIAVDPGDPRSLIDFCRRTHRTLEAVLLTHHHFDHVDGVAELISVFGPGLAVYGPRDTIALVNRPASDADVIDLAALGVRLDVMAVPGHTLDHLAYCARSPRLAAPLLFCGDTLFASGCGRIIEGTASQLLASLDALASLPDETLMCCAHEYTLKNLRFAALCDPGNVALQEWQARAAGLVRQGLPTLPTTLAMERLVNPFLRVGEPSVQEAVSRMAGSRLEGRLATFTRMRTLKDDFT